MLAEMLPEEVKLRTLKEELSVVLDPGGAVKDYDRAIALRDEIKKLEQITVKLKKDAISKQKLNEQAELVQASAKLRNDMLGMWETEEQKRQDNCTKELQRLEYNHVLAAQRLEKQIKIEAKSAHAKIKPSTKLIKLQEKESALAKASVCE